MKIRQNYTLDLNLVQDLKKKIMPQQRSQFVESAIRAKMNAKEAFTLADYSDEFLFNLILARNYQKDGSITLEKVLFEAIQLHLSNN